MADPADTVAAVVSPGGSSRAEGTDVDPDVASLLQAYDDEEPTKKRQRQESERECVCVCVCCRWGVGCLLRLSA